MSGPPTTSGFGGKADVPAQPLPCPEMAITGHPELLALLDFIGVN